MVFSQLPAGRKFQTKDLKGKLDPKILVKLAHHVCYANSNKADGLGMGNAVELDRGEIRDINPIEPVYPPGFHRGPSHIHPAKP